MARTKIISPYDKIDRLCELIGVGNGFVDPFGNEKRERFNIDPRQFLANARLKPPIQRKPTASAFASWVHGLYAQETDKESLRLGAAAENTIYQKRKSLLTSIESWSTWDLIHNGLNTPKATKTRKIYEIPELSVIGQPIRANPDLVYEELNEKIILIVELKLTNKPVPINLWPDIWAQLWVYSKIPAFSHHSKIVVAGEVWGHHGGVWMESNLSLRAIDRRDPRAPAFDSFFQSLFAVFKGTEAEFTPSLAER